MRIEGLSRHDYPGKVHVQYSDGIHTLLHMLVFSALTKRSPDTKVVALPMLRETLLGQGESQTKNRRLCWYPDNFDRQQTQSLRDDSLEHFRSGPKG